VSQLVDSALAEPKTFNYALVMNLPTFFGLIYEGLITENGLTGELQPALAESWKVADDKSELFFTMREG